MAGVRFADLQSRPMAFLDFTSVTLDEFGVAAASNGKFTVVGLLKK